MEGILNSTDMSLSTPQVAAPRAPEAREVAGGARTRRQLGSGREREGPYLLGEGGPSSFRTPSLPPVWLLAALGGPPSPGPTHSPKLRRRRWGELIPESRSTRPWGVRTPAGERACTRRARRSESGEPRAPPLRGVRSAGTPDGRWGAAEGSGSLPGGSDSKASAYNEGELGSIPGSGRSPGEGNDNPLQYSCLENPMDREAW